MNGNTEVKEENIMRKQNECPETYIDDPETHIKAIYRKILLKVTKLFIEEMKSDTAKCNICGRKIKKKIAGVPCSTYYSNRLGDYVCLPCYVTVVKPFLADMKEQ